MHIINIFYSALALSQGVLAASSADWSSRSIYQVLTDRFARTDLSTTAPCNTGDSIYCNGTWVGIMNKLDYIKDMGFDAVWISPITTQLEGNTPYGWAFHGYWQQDITTVNYHFGTEAELIALAAALHSRGMYLMLDVVINHVGWNGAPNTVNYTAFNPFSSPSQYHTYCPINYTDTANLTQIEDCWLGDTVVSLPDLRTEDASVANTWNTWIANTVSKYSIDGLRLDSAMQVDPAFWAGFGSASNMYMVGEVYNADPTLVCSYQNELPGLLNYPVYWPLFRAFTSTSGNISALASAMTQMTDDCKDTSLLGSFSENHDLPRVAEANSDINLAQNILVFTILQDGIPIVYQGQEQHYAALGAVMSGEPAPWNREALWLSGYNQSAVLYQLIAKLNLARKNAIGVDVSHLAYRNWPIYQDEHTLAMRKGNMITVLSNQGSNSGTYTLPLNSTLLPGTKVTELLTCTELTVDGGGGLAVPMSQGLPRVYYPSANIGTQCSSKSSAARNAAVAKHFPKHFQA
ncbi:hypothetical protein AMS68_005715 [Peltaster fructicola]|uniref:alpha-amylase n=1 Tax=Peltaster fructicola TaxID=286661 RepID=A0A6H0Y029_9PEZI|nr:hypothetical protein AMS68_005715 [Peltaster fructicola]